jgi:hypothetical protein
VKKLLLVVIATALLVAPSLAQSQGDAQRRGNITMSEFRQTLVDVGTFVDAQKGTDFARQFQAIDDETLTKMYPAVPDGRQFQTLVAKLKRYKFSTRSSTQASPNFNRATPRSNFQFTPLVVTPACGAPDAIISNTGACTPGYPDPTDGAWQFMVGAARGYTSPAGVPTFSPSDFASISSQQCSLDAEVTLQQIFVILTAVVNSASPFCNIIPAPFNALCWAPVGAIEIADSVIGGFFQDCVEQDGLVNAAKIDAGFQNTVTIDADLGKSTATLAGDISNSTTEIDAHIASLDTHLTNVDNHIAAEFAALNANLLADFTALTNQLTQGNALLDANLRQVMKLELEPEGQRKIVPAILTCTGTDCPNVLNKCPAAGCSWNNVGPLP